MSVTTTGVFTSHLEGLEAIQSLTGLHQHTDGIRQFSSCAVGDAPATDYDFQTDAETVYWNCLLWIDQPDRIRLVTTRNRTGQVIAWRVTIETGSKNITAVSEFYWTKPASQD